MKKIISYWIILLSLTLLYTSVSAQGTATPCIDAPYGWEYHDETKSILINKVKDGDVIYFVADVQLANVSAFRTQLDKGMATVSDLASRADAVLAINGDDYAVHKHGIIFRNGELLRAQNTTRHLLVVDSNGEMSVKTDRKNENFKKISKDLVSAGAWQSFEFGPVLVENGKKVAFGPEFDVISTKPTRLEPRTAIGQIGPLHYIIIIVDGRQDGYSIGMTLQDLQQLFLRYGAQTAFNLDGGGSTEIWFRGEILNRPAGGKEREVSDIICF